LTPFTSPGISPPADVSVHTGFLNSWNAVADSVVSIVKNQLSTHSKYAIVSSGHSLGGALASLAAISLKGNFPNSAVRMYTYGQPRTGNDNYAFWINDQLGDQVFRSTHTNDGVPTIIPILLGYRHHGIEYWQNPDPASANHTKECAADGEDPTCSASIIPSLLDFITPAHFDYYGIQPFAKPFCN